MDLTLKMHKNSRVKRLRVQTISLNILMKNFIHLILVTHSSPSSLIFYEDYMDFCYTVLVDDVARTEFDWKIYHLVEEDIDEMFNQYKTHIG